MKKITLFFALITCLSTAWSQNKSEGVVVYEHKMNLHKNMKDEAMKAMVPEFRTTEMQLNFKGAESLYKGIPKDEEDEGITNSDGNGQTRIVIKMPQNEMYRNFDTQESIETQNLAGQKFLIIDSLKKANWKLTGEIKKIHGYDCMKATSMSKVDNRPVVAWFAEAIPVSHGPTTFGGLPGLIMEVDVNDGQMIYTTKKIDFKAITKDDLKKPTSGKKVTQAEFDKQRDEWMKEMGIQPGSGTRMKIIRN